MKKSIGKLLSMALTLALLLGCTAGFGIISEAAVTGAVTEDFSSLEDSENIPASLGASALRWISVDTRNNTTGVCTYEKYNRSDLNGYALKWTGTASVTGNHWQTGFWPSDAIALNNDLAGDAAEGSQSWLSFDFMIEGNEFTRNMSLYDYNTTAATALPIFSKAKNQANATSVNGLSLGQVAGNGWHTFEMCQEKLADSKSEIKVFFDGKYIGAAAFDALKPFYKMIIWQGDASVVGTTGSLYIDNIKIWKDTGADENREMLLYKFDTAEDFLATYQAAVPAGSALANAPGSCGKSADDSVIRMTVGDASQGSAQSTNMIINPPRADRTNDRYDIVMEYDMKASDMNRQRNIGAKVVGTNASTGAYATTTAAISFNTSGQITAYASTDRYLMWMPVNQWNHYAVRFENSGVLSMYINGRLAYSQNIGVKDMCLAPLYPLWTQASQSADYPGCVTEIDNFKVSYMRNTTAVSRLTAPRPVYRNYDFTGIANNENGYKIINGTGSATAASPDMYYSNVSAGYGNLDAIRSGFDGKSSDDKVMKFYSTLSGSNWKQVECSSANSIWGGTTPAPGSTVRGGVSLLLNDEFFGNTLEGRDKRIVLTVKPSHPDNQNVMSQAEIDFTAGSIKYKGKTFGSFQTISETVIPDKWYRVEYVLNVADGSGEANTVDFYIDGKLITESPIEIDYDYPQDTAQDDTDPVGNIALDVIDQGMTPVYLDDFTFEYIPAGCERDSIDKRVTAANENESDISINNLHGAITMLDNASSVITAAQLSSKICENTPITVVDAYGASVSGTAAGNYAVLERGIYPAIYYSISDIAVDISDGKVNAYLLYDGDENTVMYTAAFKEGKLVQIGSDTSADGVLKTSVTYGDADSYKVFLWKSASGMQPYFAPASGEIAEEEVVIGE